jgi:hypothetical protein
VRAARDQAGDVRDVGQQDAPDLAGDLGEGGKSIVRGIAVPPQMIIFGRSARRVPHLVHVDPAGVRPTRSAPAGTTCRWPTPASRG